MLSIPVGKVSLFDAWAWAFDEAVPPIRAQAPNAAIRYKPPHFGDAQTD